jgi:hypothetical protein
VLINCQKSGGLLFKSDQVETLIGHGSPRDLQSLKFSDGSIHPERKYSRFPTFSSRTFSYEKSRISVLAPVKVTNLMRWVQFKGQKNQTRTKDAHHQALTFGEVKFVKSSQGTSITDGDQLILRRAVGFYF